MVFDSGVLELRFCVRWRSFNRLPFFGLPSPVIKSAAPGVPVCGDVALHERRVEKAQGRTGTLQSEITPSRD
jgi:hypothetical protein